MCLVLLLIIRWHLARENKRRDDELVTDNPYDNVYIERTVDSVVERIKVAKVDPASSSISSSDVDRVGIS